MPYQLGSHIAQHNRRMNARTTFVPLAAAAQAAGGLARGVYQSLPSFSEQKLVNRAVRASHEPKNVDFDDNSFNLSLTAVPQQFLLNGMLQGSAGTTRSGRQVKLDSLRLAMTFFIASPYDLVRVLVVLDKESRGAACAIADVLAYNSQGFDQTNSSYNFDNVPSRITVLHDSVLPMNQGYGTVAVPGNFVVHREFVLPTKQVVHYYNTSAGTVADIDSGAIFLFLIGAQAVTAASGSFSSRIVFRDL